MKESFFSVIHGKALGEDRRQWHPRRKSPPAPLFEDDWRCQSLRLAHSSKNSGETFTGYIRTLTQQASISSPFPFIQSKYQPWQYQIQFIISICIVLVLAAIEMIHLDWLQHFLFQYRTVHLHRGSQKLGCQNKTTLSVV